MEFGGNPAMRGRYADSFEAPTKLIDAATRLRDCAAPRFAGQSCLNREGFGLLPAELA
jgi:hypothetical protein